MTLKTHNDTLTNFNQAFTQKAKELLPEFGTTVGCSRRFVDFLQKVEVVGGRIGNKLHERSAQQYTLYAVYEKRNVIIDCGFKSYSFIENDEGDSAILETLGESTFLERVFRESGVQQFLTDLASRVRGPDTSDNEETQYHWVD